MVPRIKVGDLVYAQAPGSWHNSRGLIVGEVLQVDGVMLRIRWNNGKTTTRPKGTVTKTEWHGCSDPQGHSFDEGVCPCGMDLRLKSEKKAA